MMKGNPVAIETKFDWPHTALSTAAKCLVRTALCIVSCSYS
jgi:hypothetical protein